MGYQKALEKGWGDIESLADKKIISARLLSDTYTIDTQKRTIISESCNVPAKDYISILLLHYLEKKLKLKSMPGLTGEWIDFNQLEGGEAYYPAFKKRTIDHVLKKYGSNPDGLLKTTERMPAEKGGSGDAGIIVRPFEGVPILITMWKADEEFGPSANILFDKNISQIFCTEDVVVLTELVVHQL